jgi:hypothetical protein
VVALAAEEEHFHLVEFVFFEDSVNVKLGKLEGALVH